MWSVKETIKKKKTEDGKEIKHAADEEIQFFSVMSLSQFYVLPVWS